MSEAATESNETKANGAAPEKAKKKPQRKPLWIAIPHDIDNLEAADPEVPEPPEADEDGKKETVESVTMPSPYHLYVVPGGPGQKRAVNDILASHNVDLRNIGRVRIFAGDKPFEAEPQYNIRWK